MKGIYIFTFWEPENSMPAYLKLCMQSWIKHLPDYEIINLNYKNLNQYLPNDLIKRITYNKIALPQQADCIRAWLLHLHGGYWFDIDTILINDTIARKVQEYECSMLGNAKNRTGVNIGFIYAKKSSKIIKKWAEEIPDRVANYKKVLQHKLLYKFFKNKEYKNVKHFGYFGNNILDPLIKQSTNKELFILDKKELNAFLENELINEQNPTNRYQNYYFYNDLDYKKTLEKNKGVICLHNSWTPKEYKQMSKEEFLNQNCTLTKIIKDILL